MNEIILNQILIPSLQRLYQVDYDNIRLDVSERNICARLAHHMENIMREYDQVHQPKLFGGYFADVEYNRMRNGEPKHYEISKNQTKYMVSDLLIQSRGYRVIFLAVEMKKKVRMQNADKDRERLISLVKPSALSNRPDCVHDTKLGAFIVYGKDGIQLELYTFSNEEDKVEVTKYQGDYNQGNLIMMLSSDTSIF